MTVKEFYKYGCESDLKVLSGYNGKVLCRRFDPKKHTEIGEREISSYQAEEEVTRSGFSVSHDILYVVTLTVLPNVKKTGKQTINFKELTNEDLQRLCKLCRVCRES